jgi:hypothetical protein
MTEEELHEQIETGRQAEEFLRYTQEHPYFSGLLDRIKLELMQQIFALHPMQKDEFTTKMICIQFIPEIMGAVSGDIYLASDAFAKLNNEKEPGGLL